MSASSPLRSIVRIMIYLVVAYLVLLLGVFLVQRRMLYFPQKLSLQSCMAMAERAGFESWHNASGDVIGWKQLSKTNGPHHRVLIAHGNAGCAIDRVDYALRLNQAAACDVFILEYPGYGPRSGSPTQKNL